MEQHFALLPSAVQARQLDLVRKQFKSLLLDEN
jgi:hypothetical protein